MESKQEEPKYCEMCEGPHDRVLHKKLRVRKYTREYQQAHKVFSYTRGPYNKNKSLPERPEPKITILENSENN